MMTSHKGLILTAPEEEEWRLGTLDTDVNPSGDWTTYRAADEPQSRPEFDTNGCAIFATTKAFITLANFYGFKDFPKDVSERYLGVLANTNQYGTDVHVVAEVIRTEGMVPAEVLPWISDMKTFNAYYTPRPMDVSILSLGRAWLDKFVVNHKWVFPLGHVYTPKEKAELLKAALKKGTVCVSISGDYRYKSKRLFKHDGEPDTHLVQLLSIDKHGYGIIHDQYPPYIKTLDKNYDHNAAKIYFLSRNTNPPKKSWWDALWDSFATVWPGSK